MADSQKNLRRVGSLIWLQVSDESEYPALVVGVEARAVMLRCLSIGSDISIVHATDEEFTEHYRECTEQELIDYHVDTSSMLADRISDAKDALNNAYQDAKSFAENAFMVPVLWRKLNTEKK